MSIAFKLGQLARRSTIVTKNAVVSTYDTSVSTAQSLAQGWSNPDAEEQVEAVDLTKLTKAQLIALVQG